MKIFVLNLAKDVRRREHMIRQLDALELDYEMIPAVYGAGLSDEERRVHYDDAKAKWRQSRSLVPAEIGCALSHVKAYREIEVRAISCALILEDDVVLPSNLALFLSECQAMLDMARPEVWLLSPAIPLGEEAGERSRTCAGHSVLPFRSGVYASSYVVTAAAARSLLAELYPVGDVADCWGRLQSYGVVDLFVVKPPLIEQNQEDFGSSTTDDLRREVRNNVMNWLAYKARRTRLVICDLLYAPYRRRARHRRIHRRIVIF